MFEHIPPYPGDPILSLNEDFQRDSRANKINLSIGVYFDDAARLPVMQAVREAETTLLDKIGPKPYLPMEGDAAYRNAVQRIVFGANSKAVADERIATIQTIGGSGALKVGADFLKRYFPNAVAHVSDPTWDNHCAVLEGAGIAVKTYPYYDPASGGLRFDALLDAVDKMPAGSILLLHACCHNPTGVDLSSEQWEQLLPLIRRQRLIPFLDMAYQGFGDGLNQDASAIRLLTETGLPLLVASSFSKNFSLYGERCGALNVVCRDAGQAENVLGQLKATIRRNYSSPPMHGARLVTAVLSSPDLHASWEQELAGMRERIRAMRAKLHQGLSERLPGRDFGYILEQRGMFSYTGLSVEQIDRLREAHGVYLVRNGRMCVAGLNHHNVDDVAEAIAAVMR